MNVQYQRWAKAKNAENTLFIVNYDAVKFEEQYLHKINQIFKYIYQNGNCADIFNL